MGHPILQAILEGQYKRGLQLYADFQTPTPSDDRWAGYCLFAQGDLLSAKDLLARAWARGCLSAAIELATTYRHLGEFEAARAHLQDLPWKDLSAFDGALAERESGMLYAACGQLEKARHALERAWALAQGQPEVLRAAVALAIGWAEALAGFDVRATHYFDVAVDSSHSIKRAQALVTRGLSLVYAGRYEQAEGDLQEAQRWRQDLPVMAPILAYTYGVLRRAQGQWHEALEHYQEAARLANERAEVDSAFFSELGACAVLASLGELDEATAALHRAAKHTGEPRKAVFWRWRAAVLHGLSGDEAAASELRGIADEFVEMGLHREAAWVTLHEAEAYARVGETEAVQVALRVAIDGRHLLGSGAPLVVELRDLPHVQRLLMDQPDAYSRVLRDDWRSLGGCAPLGVQLITLGQGTICLEGQPVRLRLRRGIEVLAYLMQHRSVAREQLLNDLWPEVRPRDAANNFHQIKRALEKSLPGLALPYDPVTQTYSLESDGLRVHWDVQAIKDELEGTVTAVEHALQTYGGPFLPMASTSWAQQVRREVESCIVNAGMALLDRWIILGEHAKCLALAQRLREVDPYNDTLVEVVVDASFHLEGLAAAQHLLKEIQEQFVLEVGEFPPRLEALYTHLR
ncbi:hypothetical protein LAJ19_14990 (plasmid) [Deinococcus taeanensis]|uniref:BTAD domain-containing putative transcriptional regulator n=1 Tax=Deinococcus taeanensis TaxID=2737050 RepID=UPI001CDD2998|nr:BTAD domain-containing putative transcriptional regulator [Deinococcus taeanensis]UBV44112.1 hypothetical protein LAJ19_14990 [Deinococcus taeanensis]